MDYRKYILDWFNFISLLFLGIAIIILTSCGCPNIPPNYSKDTTIVKIENRSFDLSDSLKIVYTSDTNIVTKPFIASLFKVDSLRKDTVFVKYRFPENRIEVKYITKNDTTFKETIRETQIKEVEKKDDLWDSVKTGFFLFLSIALLLILYKLVK